jgi:hypothetical protein
MGLIAKILLSPLERPKVQTPGECLQEDENLHRLHLKLPVGEFY